MRVALDSNVIVAAFATRGLCHDVFETCLQNHEVVISGAILREVHKSLVGKIRLPAEAARRVIEFIQENGTGVVPAKVDKSVCRDPGDRLVLGTALAGKVDCLVTGDRGLLALKKLQWVDILSPRDFWERIK